jgi:hypothetical protein
MTLDEMLHYTGKREESFRIMLDYISRINNPLVVETGCSRWYLNLDGDGASTILFDCFLSAHNGSLYSVDIDQENINNGYQMIWLLR